MKKTKLTHFLVTSLLSVTLLAGCGATPSSSEPEAIVEFITVNLPQTAVVGDTLNLDEFVDVQALVGDGSKYKVDLMGSDVATYDEATKTLTITDEGILSIKVSCGGQEAYGEMETLTEYRNAYREFSEGAGNNYFVGIIGSDQAGNLALTPDGFLSNDNYMAIPYFYFYEDMDSYQGYTTTKSGNSYTFTTSDLNGTDLVVSPGKLFDITSGIGQRIVPFSMTYDLFETYKDSTGEELLVGGAEAAAALGEMVGMNTVSTIASQGEIKDSQGKVILDSNCVDQLMVYLDVHDLGDGQEIMLPTIMWFYADTKPNDANGNLTGLFAAFYLALDPGFTCIPALDAYIEAGNEPEPIPTDGLQSYVSQIAEGKNYTVDTFIGWKDDSGKEISTHPLWIQYGWGQEGFLDYKTKSTTYLTETSYYSESTDGEVMAYLPDGNGGVTKYSNYETGNMTASSTGWTSLWEGHTGLINRLTKPGAFDYANIATVSQSSDGSTTMFMALGQGDGDKFLIELFNCIPVYGSSIASICDMQATTTGNTAAQIMFNAYIYVTASMLQIDLTVEWTTNATYHFTQTYYNFGTTEIPADKLAGLQA